MKFIVKYVWEFMLILGSYELRHMAISSEISKVIKDKSGKMLLISLTSMSEKETGEKDCAVMAGFQKDNIYVFDNGIPKNF